MKYILIFLFVFLGVKGFTQPSIDSVLATILQNNTTLAAYKTVIDADKLEHHTGLTPDNPEVEFNYLIGSPSEIGNRFDYSIQQSFDFPTAYKYRSELARLKDKQSDLAFEQQRIEIQFKAEVLCIDLIYQNILKNIYAKRLLHAKGLADAYQLKFNEGEIGILSLNKSQVNYLSLTKTVEQISIEQANLEAELMRMNGGMKITIPDTAYFLTPLQDNFDTWYMDAILKNPELALIEQEITLTDKKVNLKKAESLPKITTGYMSEQVVGEQFQGVTVGLSIPLWENKNRVKQARARSTALYKLEADAKFQYEQQLKALHTKAMALQGSITDYRHQLKIYNNEALLKQALKLGEISLTDYYLEVSLYYENVDQLLEMEHEYAKVLVVLYKYL